MTKSEKMPNVFSHEWDKHKLKPQFDAHIHFRFSVQSSTQANTLALASPTTSPQNYTLSFLISNSSLV